MFVPKVVAGMPMRQTALAEIDRVVSERLGRARVAGNAQPAAFNRQVAMYLAKRVGGWSLTKIGKFYNGRHHTTVRHAIRQIEALRAVNPDVDGLLIVLIDQVKAVGVNMPSRRERVVADSGRSGALIPFEVGQRSVAMWGRIPLGSGAVFRL
jgi:hypothetical protein